ncbi:unnamed protein product [Leptosia nina]|uniref:dolichyl-phosphate-mannose--protein mannosyltransferase n=1 Tax=Leptosia nina TaxID=320188 RepID=A0AAV1JGC7_9NEOP
MWYQPIIVLLVAGVPYFFSLDGDFVFDDTEAILKNDDVTSNSWTDLFHHDFWGSRIDNAFSHKSYRPLTIISFKLNYLFNSERLSAPQFKITNCLLHITCCLLLWTVYKTLLLRLKLNNNYLNVEFLAALLFSSHPVHVEAVSGIVGRADILAAIAFFISFLMYDRAMNDCWMSIYYLSSSFLFAGIAMLFKENGVTVLGFCVIYELVVKIKTAKSTGKTAFIYTLDLLNRYTIIRWISTTITVFCFLYLRWIIMGRAKPEFKATDNPAAFSSDLFTNLATYNYIYFINILLLMWPKWLCYDWSMGCIPLIEDYSDYRIFFVVTLYVYAFLIIWYLLKSGRISNFLRLVILSQSLFVIPFLPASNLFYAVGFVIAERILYIPSAGYCLLVVIGLQKILLRLKSKNLRRIMISIFHFVILMYALRSMQRASEWQTEYKLFTSGLLVCPLNAKVHYNVAKVADAKNNVSWAMAEYQEAIRLYPDYYQAMNNYAILLKNHKQFSEAEFYLRKAISLKNDFPAAWMNLGIVLASMKNYAEAETAYNNSLKYRKQCPDCHYNLGNLYLELNKTESATASWFQAIQLNPKHKSAWTNLLAVLDNIGDMETALQTIPKALKELPDTPSVIFAIANIYGKLDQYEKAEEYFLKAIDLFKNKGKPIHYANLGVLYHRWRKYDLAEEMYEKALELQPSFKSARTNLNSLRKLKMKIK